MRIPLPEPVARIYQAVADLEALYPGRKFTPDGHLVGSIGEVVASEALKLTLCTMSQTGHDAFDCEGRKVQIKITAGKKVALSSRCERMIVLQIVSAKEAEVVYDGPGAPIWDAAGTMGKNGQRPISLARIRSLTASLRPASSTASALPEAHEL
ncbi:MAG: hypothetical protein JNM86_07975 [Phycisphaerae bacterium]|nr:hypothetical protein [Phycisphaerae bacterium]